jgi:hypothetical protein
MGGVPGCLRRSLEQVGRQGGSLRSASTRLWGCEKCPCAGPTRRVRLLGDVSAGRPVPLAGLGGGGGWGQRVGCGGDVGGAAWRGTSPRDAAEGRGVLDGRGAGASASEGRPPGGPKGVSPGRVLRWAGYPTGLAGGQGGWPGQKTTKRPTSRPGARLPSGGQTVRTSVGSATSARWASLVLLISTASTRANVASTSSVVISGRTASQSGWLRGLLLTGAKVLTPRA